MFTYRVDCIQRGTFQALEEILKMSETRINEWAVLGWELDKMMPIEQNGYSSGAILVFRKPVTPLEPLA